MKTEIYFGNYFLSRIMDIGPAGIEPTQNFYEKFILPLNYGPDK